MMTTCSNKGRNELSSLSRDEEKFILAHIKRIDETCHEIDTFNDYYSLEHEIR
jgi:hypothetical protein